jgi:transketolase
MDNNNIMIYVLLGDAEIIEGSVWEAVQLAAFYSLSNIIAIVDCNRLGQSSATIVGHDLEKDRQRFESFGWHAQIVDGHNIEQLVEIVDDAKVIKDKPKVILANTIKGKGISWLEDKQGFHGKALPPEEYELAKKDLLSSCPSGLSQKEKHFVPSMLDGPFVYKGDKSWIMPPSSYNKEDLLPTRKAFGQSLAALGNVCDRIVSLDAEVKNSTYAQIFEEFHPKRFVQCFVAEQNMVSMAVGMHRRNKIPFVSTFSCFFSRAHDQIRMSAIGQSALRLVGSHAGVSIGHDGPSQMGLEDICMMRALPQSIVLYPCDAQSTWKLVNQMSNYHDGISYLRTTRSSTPVLYDKNEEFIIGGCKVLYESKNDIACVIAAGITLHEALSAYCILQQQGIAITVIDCYSIKPLDEQTIARCTQQANKKVITVEDHYLQGGIGEAITYALRNKNVHVTCLAVTDLPRSGSLQELLSWAKIDAQAIVNQVLCCL